MKRVFMDGDQEVVEVVLRMQKRNFDALVQAAKDGKMIPVGPGFAIVYDESESRPVARLMHKSAPEMREEQESMGYFAVAVVPE